MVKSQTTSITPATHADLHRHGGADPLTGDVRIDDVPQGHTSAAVVHNGAAPNVWTDLDLSGEVGANTALVVLEVFNNDAAALINVGFRPKGNANEHFCFTDQYSASNKCQLNDNASLYEGGIVMCATDATGFLEWKANGVTNIIITLLGYVLLA